MTAFVRSPQHGAHVTAAEFGVALDARVTAADGKKLGTISDLRGRYLKVHRGIFSGEDCWFDVDNVLAVMDDEVVLDFARNALDEYRVPDDIVRDDRTDARTDRLLDDHQLTEQRLRMERELANQK